MAESSKSVLLGRDAKARPDEAETLRTLNAFAVDLIAIPSVEDLFWYVARNVVGRLNFVDCVIYQANKDQTELVQVAALGEKNPFGRSIINPLRIPFGQGITGQAAQNRETIIVDDLLKDQNYIPDTRPARSEICVPLVFRNRVVGVIDSEHPDPGAFGDAARDILTTVAAMTSAKLELLAEAERSNQRYQDLVDSHVQLAREASNRKALEAKLFEARKLEAIGRLTGQFAHEFNNLLTVISGNLEFLDTEIKGPEARGYLTHAQTAARRGARLIRDMLAFSRRTRLVPTVIDLNRFVTTICERSTPELGEAITLDLTLAEGLWPVTIDAKAAKNALFNLIGNARDAMPEGGRIEITTQNVSHSWSDRDGLAIELAAGEYVRVSVRDHGMGMSEQCMQQIFDPFFTTKPVGAGTGLGLSMILGFMQQSGGTVAVQSVPGKGSLFELYFPAAPKDANDLLTINP
ncbi:MAG: ATP-binding protein [Roseovarius sp.]|nr:ATP-binding protein [Roseovarius sp.]